MTRTATTLCLTLLAGTLLAQEPTGQESPPPAEESTPSFRIDALSYGWMEIGAVEGDDARSLAALLATLRPSNARVPDGGLDVGHHRILILPLSSEGEGAVYIVREDGVFLHNGPSASESCGGTWLPSPELDAWIEAWEKRESERAAAREAEIRAIEVPPGFVLNISHNITSGVPPPFWHVTDPAEIRQILWRLGGLPAADAGGREGFGSFYVYLPTGGFCVVYGGRITRSPDLDRTSETHFRDERGLETWLRAYADSHKPIPWDGR
ncbi:MAG: hypothetical protein HY608_10185 [Planctomycetes bacterium]|nr:hypothetical protein [Planctomycetota bacterium]